MPNHHPSPEEIQKAALDLDYCRKYLRRFPVAISFALAFLGLGLLGEIALYNSFTGKGVYESMFRGGEPIWHKEFGRGESYLLHVPVLIMAAVVLIGFAETRPRIRRKLADRESWLAAQARRVHATSQPTATGPDIVTTALSPPPVVLAQPAEQSLYLRGLIVFVAYLVFYLPGLILNIIFLAQAKSKMRVVAAASGQIYVRDTVKGLWLLTAELIVLGMIPLVVVLFSVLAVIGR